jgi:hypothetical protein
MLYSLCPVVQAILVPAQDMVDQLGDEWRQNLFLLLVEGLSNNKI